MRSYLTKLLYSHMMALIGPATRGCAAGISTLTDASSPQARVRAWTSILSPIRPRLLSSMPASSPLVLQALHRKCNATVMSPRPSRQYQSLHPAASTTRISYGLDDSVAALDPSSASQPPPSSAVSEPTQASPIDPPPATPADSAAAAAADAAANNGTGATSAAASTTSTTSSTSSSSSSSSLKASSAPAAAPAAQQPAAAPSTSSASSAATAAAPAAASTSTSKADDSSSSTAPAQTPVTPSGTAAGASPAPAAPSTTTTSSSSKPDTPAAPGSAPATASSTSAAPAAPAADAAATTASSSSTVCDAPKTPAPAPAAAVAAGPEPPPQQEQPTAAADSHHHQQQQQQEEGPTILITRKGLELVSGAAMLPHPDKAHRGGEDSFFVAEHRAAIGVADGVGGWAEIGVDAGAYARLLMAHAKDAAEASLVQQPERALDAQAILEAAYLRTNVQGSSTACVAVLNGSTLAASNVGDSGFLLVRNAKAAFQSPQQQHNFNFPYQLGSAESMSDQPAAAMRFEMDVRPGDIVVMGSDGLWDNVFAEEVALIASRCAAKGETAETAAQVLCRYARMRASDAKYHSPFSYAAMQAGYVYIGGKMDDVTVLVSYVSQPSKL